MRDEVVKAVENDWSVALENAGVLRSLSMIDKRFAKLSRISDQITALCADHCTMAQALRDQEAEIAGYRTLLDLLRTDAHGRRYECVESRAGTMVNVATHLTKDTP